MATGAQPSSFGAHLRRLRDAAGLTQEELAERAGLTAKAIAALERGRRTRPRPHTVRSLAEGLGLSDADRAALFGMLVRPDSQHLISVDSRSMVPVSLTRLIGRDAELAELGYLLRSRETRLLVLTGPGGIGKTRLAIEATQLVAPDFADGAAIVELAAIRDPALALATIAQVLEPRSAADRPAIETLEALLADQELLLTLDNLEQIPDIAVDLVRLLSLAPRLVIVATSRTPLRVRGEQVYPVLPLTVPDISPMPTPDDLSASSAVQLFVESARAIAPSFVVTQANAMAVGAICRRLDGLPLALELAASHLNVLGPAEILDRLDQALPLLTGGLRDLPARQRTLRATIKWSEELLPIDAQSLLARLGAFSGGWTLDAAEAVSQTTVASATAALVDHHLVQSIEQPDGSRRFGMLETIREYALERLAERGDEDTVRRAHLTFYARFAEAHRPDIWCIDFPDRIATLDAERENLRAALTCAFDHDEIEVGVRLAGTLHTFWWASGLFHEGHAWLERAAECRHGVSHQARAGALVGAGVLSLRRGESDKAVARLHEAQRMYEDLGDDNGVAYALYHEGYAESVNDHLDAAIRAFQASVEVFDRVANAVMLAAAQTHLAVIHQRRGDTEQSRQIQADALTRAHVLGHEPLLAMVFDRFGGLACDRREYDLAGSYFQQMLELDWIVRDNVGLSNAFIGIGRLAADLGQPIEAARLLGAADARLCDGRSGMLRERTAEYRATAESVRGCLGSDRLIASWLEGSELSPNDALAFAKDVAARCAGSGPPTL